MEAQTVVVPQEVEVIARKVQSRELKFVCSIDCHGAASRMQDADDDLTGHINNLLRYNVAQEPAALTRFSLSMLVCYQLQSKFLLAPLSMFLSQDLWADALSRILCNAAAENPAALQP